MLSFVAFIAIINLLLGYAIGAYMAASRGPVVRISGDVSQLSRGKFPTDLLPLRKSPIDRSHSMQQQQDIEPAPPQRDVPRAETFSDEASDYPLFASESFAEQLEEAVENR